MTQAFNLSQLANNTNTTGQINADTAIYNTVNVANGGTNLSATPANGQLPIGNGSGYALATLTAGSGIGITNAAGAITISNTGGGVTSLTAGNGIAVSASTGAVTVSLDFYTGTTVANTSYPVGTYIGSVQSGDGCSYSNPAPNANLPGSGLRITGNNFKYGAGTTGIAGTWRSRSSETTAGLGSSILILVQRVA